MYGLVSYATAQGINIRATETPFPDNAMRFSGFPTLIWSSSWKFLYRSFSGICEVFRYAIVGAWSERSLGEAEEGRSKALNVSAQPTTKTVAHSHRRSINQTNRNTQLLLPTNISCGF